MMKLQTFLQDDVILKQGDIGDNFYVIIEGMAEVFTQREDFLYFDID